MRVRAGRTARSRVGLLQARFGGRPSLIEPYSGTESVEGNRGEREQEVRRRGAGGEGGGAGREEWAAVGEGGEGRTVAVARIVEVDLLVALDQAGENRVVRTQAVRVRAAALKRPLEGHDGIVDDEPDLLSRL